MKTLPIGALCRDQSLNEIGQKGDVIVMQGLLEDATPDQLAGVLAHEMAHVIEKHAMRHDLADAAP